MIKLFQSFFLLAALSVCAGGGVEASPADLVPSGSGLYDAVVLLAQQHLLPAGAPDVNSLLGVTGRLYTRAEFADAIRGVTKAPSDRRAAAALAFARNMLAPELSLNTGDAPTSSFAATGFVEPEIGGHAEVGDHLDSYGALYGRGRLLGSLGRDGAYTVSATNIYRQTRDHDSFTTRGMGMSGGDNPGALEGIDEAYATALGRNGFRATLGYVRQRWGSGYRGDLLVGDNAPAHPTTEVEFPFSLGHALGAYRFTQFESIYKNDGKILYEGGRRLEHGLGDRTSLSVAETYDSIQFRSPAVLALPYYAYQHTQYSDTEEPNFFNYNANIGLTVLPQGPNTNMRLYGQLFIDDIQTPKAISKGDKVPRKIAYLLGYSQDFPSGSNIVVEFAHADRESYTKTADAQAPLAWFSGDLPMGHPIGPNGNEIFLRLGQRLSNRLDLSLAGRIRHRVADDFPAPNIRAFDLAFSYRMTGSQSVGLRFSDYQEDPFTGVSSSPSTAGGADYGEYLRRKIVAISFLQAF